MILMMKSKNKYKNISKNQFKNLDKNIVNNKSTYYDNYDSLVRFISYYDQIRLILETRTKQKTKLQSKTNYP